MRTQTQKTVVSLRNVGAVLNSIAHLQPAKERTRITKAEMAEYCPHAAMYLMAVQTTAIYCAASFHVSFCEGALS